jgi:hypothetical protein
LKDVVIPKVKDLLHDIRINKQHKDLKDENKFNDKIYEEIFKVVGVLMKELYDNMSNTIVKAHR